MSTNDVDSALEEVKAAARGNDWVAEIDQRWIAAGADGYWPRGAGNADTWMYLVDADDLGRDAVRVALVDSTVGDSADG